MEKFIEVYDDIIPLDLSNLVEEKVLKNGSFEFTFFDKFYDFHPIHSPNLPRGFGFGNTYIKNKNVINPNLIFYNQILTQTSSRMGFIIEDIITARIWLITPEQDNNICIPHTDLMVPHYVCLYYINDTDGDTIFFEDDKNTIFKRVSPKKGRVVIFDGSIFHSSSSPTTTPRAVINYNFTTI